MFPHEVSSQPEPPKPEPKVSKKVLAIGYWVVAVSLLVISLLVVIQVTRPQKTPGPTPNLTATLQQALLEALGPPTDTLTPSVTPLPTQSPTPSRTPLPTLTPTDTLTPSPTYTSTPTPLPPPLTPALPNADEEAFTIAQLIPSQYGYAIALMQGVPERLPDGPLNEGYHDAFYPAVVMASEALLRYPDDQRAPGWRWDLAYNLARTGDNRSSLRYANLFGQAVREQRLTTEELPDWVVRQDPRLSLTLIRVDPLPGNTSNSLLDINTTRGSIFLWLAETPEKTTVHPLSDETNFQHPKGSDLFWGDINGDGLDELIINTPGESSRSVSLPRVFDLAQETPKELLFRANQDFEIGLENEYQWSVVNDQTPADLQFQATAYPPCPATITQTYHWTGQWLEHDQETYTVEPISLLLEYCELLVDQASSVWGYEAAIQVMEKLLPDWPPASASSGKTYPLDETDEWRYRLGIYYALTGEIEFAKAYFEEIIRNPAIPGSQWVTPAQEFLAGLQTPADIYAACVKASFCDPRVALENWVASFAPNQAAGGLYYLGEGVTIRSTGEFDFEGDGLPERWLTLRHQPSSRLEFWILAETKSGAQALYVDTVENNQPLLRRYVNYDGQSYVWLNATQSFRLVRFPEADEVFIRFLPPTYYYADFTNQLAYDSLKALVSGLYPVNIHNRLMTHLDSDDFACLNNEDCARYYYALGLAAELSGWDEAAVEYYLKIWWDYFESPFSTIARLKLAYKPGYGPPPTPSDTPTQTATATGTATPTPTPSYTPTQTLTGSATLSPTASNTVDPNVTPTETGTATETFTPAPSDTPGTPYP